jgi:hypothetical protein
VKFDPVAGEEIGLERSIPFVLRGLGQRFGEERQDVLDRFTNDRPAGERRGRVPGLDLAEPIAVLGLNRKLRPAGEVLKP